MNDFVDSISGECEIIIANTETIEELLDSESLEDVDFYLIRQSAENLLELLESGSVSSEDFDVASIELYQNVKYILEELEENMGYDSNELLTCYNEIRVSTDEIRGLVTTQEME